MRKLELYESAAKNGEKIILDAGNVDLFDTFLPKAKKAKIAD